MKLCKTMQVLYNKLQDRVVALESKVCETPINRDYEAKLHLLDDFTTEINDYQQTLANTTQENVTT